MLRAMHLRNVHPLTVHHIMQNWQNERSRLAYMNEISKPIIHTRGTRQGDPTSPLLFRWVIEDALEEVLPWARHYELGVKTAPNGPLLNYQIYADDCIILGTSPADTQYLIGMLEIAMQRVGLQITCQKSEYMTNAAAAHFRLNEIE